MCRVGTHAYTVAHKRFHSACSHTRLRLQYLNYEELKKQVDLLERYLETQRSANPDNLTWLKLLFQHTIDSEIAKVLSFYDVRRKELIETTDLLQKQEKPLVLACLNVRPLACCLHCRLQYSAKMRFPASTLPISALNHASHERTQAAHD